MAESFGIKRGDTLPKLRGTLYEDTGKTIPVDLSSAAHVTFIMAPSVGATIKTSKEVELLNGGEFGQFEVTFDPSEVNEAATYQAEFEVIWSEGPPIVKQTYPKEGFIVITVHPDLGDPIQ